MIFKCAGCFIVIIQRLITMFSFSMPTADQFIRSQTPISMMPPPITPQFPMPQLSIPQFSTPLLAPDFCRMIPTPDRQLALLPPMMYDIGGNQPIGLVGLKNAHNAISTQCFDGTIGVGHPLEPFIQAKMLEDLSAKIDEYCYPK